MKQRFAAERLRNDTGYTQRLRRRTSTVKTRAELAGDCDERHVWIGAPGRAQTLDTEIAWHVHVDDHENHRWRRLCIVVGEAVHAISLRRQPFGQQRMHEQVMFDNHNARHHRIRRADTIRTLFGDLRASWLR